MARAAIYFCYQARYHSILMIVFKEFFVRIWHFCRILNLTHKSARALVRADKSPEGLSREYTHHIMKTWADAALKTLNVEVKAIGTPSTQATLFVGNHMSYLDIPLLMSQAPVVFIAKKELAKWPLFGHGMRCVGTVFVDRSSVHSRKDAAETVAPYIKSSNQSVAIFPSGTTKLLEEKQWRWGAFLIAKRFSIPVQPFRLRYTPARLAAFIDDDAFAPHLWRLLGTKNLKAEIEFHDPIQVDDPEAEANKWWLWAREKINEI
jgi:1-acyl-sn-glycerol-3-phosphate acyltransferase